MLQNAQPIDSAMRMDYASSYSLRHGAANNAAYYQTFMRVSFRHPYFNHSGDACPDLAARPTAATLRLMASLGLLFRDDGTSFSVLYDRNRTATLASYLRRQGRDEQFWTRLSFVLSSRSPYFINVTAIPIDLDPQVQNFYFSNQTAHVDPAVGILLNSGRIVSAEQLLRVTGPQYQAIVSQHTLGIAVRDISGEVVLCEPRCVPVDAAAPKPGCLAWLVALPETSPNRCRDRIYLNFGTLPEGRYTIDTIASTGDVTIEEIRLYTSEVPTPLCLIDLLFSPPYADAGGIYPVSDLTKDDVTIVGIDYVVNFDARKTFWRYYIVPHSADRTYDDLAIECLAPDPSLRFTGPSPAIIANGAPAYCFVSAQPLLLQQQSAYRFRLKGRRRHHRFEDDTLVDRLPVAAAEQVLPRTDSAGTHNYSDIYVYV